MRKFFALVFLALGIGVGVFVTLVGKGSWGEGVVMVGLCLLFTVPVAGAIAGIGGRRGRRQRGVSWMRGPSGLHLGGGFKGDVPIRRWDR